jgi:hypothetical protein
MRSFRPLRALPTIVAIAAFALLVVAFTSAIGGAPAATSAPAASATVALAPKAAGSLALKKASVKVSARKPATASKTRWKLPLYGTPAIDATSIALDGELRFGIGKRQVSFIGMRLSFGAKPTITGALGKKKYTVLTLAKAPQRDTAARTIRFDKVAASLSSSAAKAIRTQLKLKRAVTGRIGTLSLVASAGPSVTPTTPTPTSTSPTTTTVAPPPPVTTTTTTPPPATTPTDTTTTPTTPVDPCRVEEAPLPSTPPPAGGVLGQTEWSAAGLPGGDQFGYQNLRSWINYVTSCWSPAGTVEPVDGTTRVGGDKYTYDLSIVGDSTTGGTRTVTHAGTLAYRLAGHGIDTRLRDVVVMYDVATGIGTVTASGQYSADRANPTAPPQLFTDQVIVTLARTPDPLDSPTAFAATLTAAGTSIYGNTDAYPVGAAWGTFTVRPAAP